MRVARMCAPLPRRPLPCCCAWPRRRPLVLLALRLALRLAPLLVLWLGLPPLQRLLVPGVQAARAGAGAACWWARCVPCLRSMRCSPARRSPTVLGAW